MARQHVIPAGLIGGFSAETNGRGRDRRVWVARRAQKGIHLVPARTIGFAKDPYALKVRLGGRLDVVDRQWRVYEPSLPWAIAAAAQVPEMILDARAWVVLIQLVAGLFVRVPDYAERDAASLRSVFGDQLPEGLTPDNTNLNRLFDFQWLMSTLLFCRWTLIRLQEPVLVSNDNGFCMGRDFEGRPCAAVPLRPDLTVLVSRGPGNLRAWWDGGKWRMEGFHVVANVDPSVSVGQNRALAATAHHEVFGQSKEAVAEAVAVWESHPVRANEVPPPQLLYPDVAARQAIEQQIFTAMRLFASPPAMEPPWLLRFDALHPWAGDKAASGD